MMPMHSPVPQDRAAPAWRLGAGLAALCGLALVATPAAARGPDDVQTRRVQFAKGASSATVQGRIQGDGIVDYLVGARQGQTMKIELTTRHTATYFNLLAPGEQEVAMHNGSVNGNRFDGALPASGDYRVRVYMVRSAARRHEVANYRLAVAVAAGDAAAATPRTAGSTDAKVAGTDFHATGRLPCSLQAGQVTASCAFGVRREGAGTATVTITKPDGGQRTVFFRNGRATGYDQSQADKAAFGATRSGDTSRVRIGRERYDIPDAVVSGG